MSCRFKPALISHIKMLFALIIIVSLASCIRKHKKQDEAKPLFPKERNLTQEEYTGYKYIRSTKENTSVLEVVEQMPSFPGGDEELLKYLSDNIRYPIIAQKNGIQGKVILRFVVRENGTIGKVEILRSLDPACDKESIRVIKSMPRWISGKQNGISVPVWYTIPISFRLE